MSPPRRPFGPNAPGRLPATMVRVLAAEASDAGRLSRGRSYWSDRAVVDIEIAPGLVTGAVQGGPPTPYTVVIATTPGPGLPARRDLRIRCTCPDDPAGGACKHAVAVLFALSDEIAVDPDVVARWRSGPPGGVPLPDQPVTAGPMIEAVERSEPVDPEADDIARLVAPPLAVTLPDLPLPEPLVHPRLSDHLVADVLADALDRLRVRWE